MDSEKQKDEDDETSVVNSQLSPVNSSIILYQTEDGQTRVQCRFENETIWLTQIQIAELFQTSVPNVNQHLKTIYDDGELTEAATIKSYLKFEPKEIAKFRGTCFTTTSRSSSQLAIASAVLAELSFANGRPLGSQSTW